MLFSIIYSADYDPDGSVIYVENCRPPTAQLDEGLWQETESNMSEVIEGWHHKKWCALLTRPQFEEFVDHVMASADSTQTMGSLGAPGFGFGISPAISFDASSDSAYCNAYVTPVPHHVARHMFEDYEDELFGVGPLFLRPLDLVKAKPVDQKRWERLRDAVVNFYECGVPSNSRFDRADAL